MTAPRLLTPSTVLYLLAPPMLWAGNAVVGRLAGNLMPPVTLNFFRWALALLILLPLAHRVLRPGSPVWSLKTRFLALGLLGVGAYNALQYLALRTSTPINVTLVAASMPVWLMVTGALFFHTPITRRQVAGAALSLAGVALVLGRGDWAQLAAVQFVPGDFYILLATLSWTFYSWLLAKPTLLGHEPPALRADWSGFLLAQVAFGLVWSGGFAGAEWALHPDARIEWGWPLAGMLAFVAVGPAVVAYRCWGTGVQRVGPTVAGFFANLTPLFAAVLSAAVLGEPPHLYHAAAFALIVGGIVVSSRR